MRVSLICRKHGYVKGDHCPQCSGRDMGDPVRINTFDWVAKEDWSDIEPGLKVSSKQELMQHCDRTGNYSRAFMKHKSQGSGYEHKKRGA